jgi:hypothetical protein
MSRANPVTAPYPINDARGRVFTAHCRAWRNRQWRHYAPHKDLEPYAPAILAAMFDRALRVVGPIRVYAYSTPITPSVHLTVDPNGSKPWAWFAMDGSAGGRGLYELWAWRFGVPVTQAAEEIWQTINGG